ncbi:MAG: isochorismatase family protein [Planctomycetaceae bacterium]|nr:isochorismatase family protein [Planctomycetaceae bacterium]
MVDMQAKLLPFIATSPQVIANCVTLVKAAQLLGPPVFATEQYPKGLGGTTPELAELLGPLPDKVRFSCADVLGWNASLPGMQTQVVVAGIESHVCVLQTTFDLLAAGFQVFIPADAVGSRSELDWRIALDRMAGGGAVITTTESVLFEWCERSDVPEFKQISQLVKQRTSH